MEWMISNTDERFLFFLPSSTNANVNLNAKKRRRGSCYLFIQMIYLPYTHTRTRLCTLTFFFNVLIIFLMLFNFCSVLASCLVVFLGGVRQRLSLRQRDSRWQVFGGGRSYKSVKVQCFMLKSH